MAAENVVRNILEQECFQLFVKCLSPVPLNVPHSQYLRSARCVPATATFRSPYNVLVCDTITSVNTVNAINTGNVINPGVYR